MKEITNKGNLPKHLQAFANQLGGALSNCYSEFYEFSSIAEFEKCASTIGYEIIPTVDQSTGRGFLTGFSVEEPKLISTLTSYVKLKIYYIECTPAEVDLWTKKIMNHRLMQQEDMIQRKEVLKRKVEQRKKQNGAIKQ